MPSEESNEQLVMLIFRLAAETVPRSLVEMNVGGPAMAIQSDLMPPNVVFKTRQDDRCADDIALGKVSCYRQGLASGLTRTDTIAFTGKGWVTLSFRLLSPAMDPHLANNRTSVTMYVP